MKKVILSCLLLCLSVSYLKAQKYLAISENYWVTETGPRSNAYTIIRLYSANDNYLGEIALKCKRLTIKRNTIVRLNRLAVSFNKLNIDHGRIAALLKIKPEIIEYIKYEV